MDDTMHSYLTDCMQKQVPASFDEYNTYVQSAIENNKQLSLSAKAGKIALQGLAAVGSMFAGMAISWIVSKVAETIYNFATSVKRAKETAEEFTSSMKDMQSTQVSNSSTIAEISDEYKELSKHVNVLGEVVGLTTKETDRYYEICNQVAEIMPSLVKSYDEQGNAILKVKGHLADLNEEYKKHKQNEAIESYNEEDEKGNRKVESVFDNYHNATQRLSQMPSYEWKLDANYMDLWTTKDKQINYLSSLLQLNNDDLLQLSKKRLETGENLDYTKESYMANYLRVYGLNENSSKEEIATVRQNIETDLQLLQTEIDKSVNQIATAAMTYGQQNNKYWNLNPDLQKYFQTIFNNLTPEFIDKNALDTERGMQNFVNNFISSLDENRGDINNAFNSLFTFDFDSSNLTPEEFKVKIEKYISQIAHALNIDDVAQLKISLGVETDDTLEDKYKNAIENAKKMQEDFDWDSWFKKNSINTKEEIDNWLEIAQAANSAAEARERYAQISSVDKEVNSITSQIKSMQNLSDSFEIIDEIYADVKDKGTFEFGNLADDKFIETFSKYEEEYNNFIKTVSSSPTDINACQSAFNNLVTAWIDGSGALSNLNSETLQVTKDMLTNMGVVNAEEVANSRLYHSIIQTIMKSEEFHKVAENENATLKDLADTIIFTENEKESLIAVHPELRNQFKKTDEGIKLEEAGFKSLGLSIENLAVAQTEAQIKQTQSVIDGVNSRIEAYKIELNAIKDLGTALSEINKNSVNNAVFSATDYQDYKSMVEMDGRTDLMVSGKILSADEFNTLKKQSSQILQYGVALDKLNNLGENIANLKPAEIKYGGGKKSKGNDSKSGSDSSKDKKEYDDHREYSDLYDEILSQYEKEIEQIEKENETLQYKYEQALENGDFDIAEQLNRQINNNHKKIKDLRATMAANLRELASEKITPQIIDIAAQFEFDWSGLNIDEISDVEIEQVRQALQDDINHQKDIGVDMENAGQGDNAYNIKTAELALDKFNSLVSAAQNFETAVGNANGEGEQGLKWLEEQEKILENNLKYVKAISDEYQKQSNDIDHQVDLQRNAFNGDDVSFDFINSALEANAEKERIAHDDAVICPLSSRQSKKQKNIRFDELHPAAQQGGVFMLPQDDIP